MGVWDKWVGVWVRVWVRVRVRGWVHGRVGVCVCSLRIVLCDCMSNQTQPSIPETSQDTAS